MGLGGWSCAGHGAVGREVLGEGLSTGALWCWSRCVCGLPVALQLQGWDVQDKCPQGIGRGQWSCWAEGWFSKEMTPELFLLSKLKNVHAEGSCGV